RRGQGRRRRRPGAGRIAEGDADQAPPAPRWFRRAGGEPHAPGAGERRDVPARPVLPRPPRRDRVRRHLALHRPESPPPGSAEGRRPPSARLARGAPRGLGPAVPPDTSWTAWSRWVPPASPASSPVTTGF